MSASALVFDVMTGNNPLRATPYRLQIHLYFGFCLVLACRQLTNRSVVQMMQPRLPLHTPVWAVGMLVAAATLILVRGEPAATATSASAPAAAAPKDADVSSSSTAKSPLYASGDLSTQYVVGILKDETLGSSAAATAAAAAATAPAPAVTAPGVRVVTMTAKNGKRFECSIPNTNPNAVRGMSQHTLHTLAFVARFPDVCAVFLRVLQSWPLQWQRQQQPGRVTANLPSPMAQHPPQPLSPCPLPLQQRLQSRSRSTTSRSR